MCAYPNRKATTAQRKVETFTAYKTINAHGSAMFGHYEYSQGVHELRDGLGRPRVHEYNTMCPRGFHVFLNREAAVRTVGLMPETGKPNPFRKVISVRCKGKDVIAAESPGINFYRQVVLRRIEITPQAWSAFKKRSSK